MSGIFAKDPSFYDPGLIIKEVADFYGQTIRTSDGTSLVPQSYSHYDITYNLDNLPSSVSYYRGKTANRLSITTLADVAGSLNNKYFTIVSATDNSKYHIWFNVNGAGVDPSPLNSTGIMVSLNTNDDAVVVAAGITFMVNSTISERFTAKRNGANVEILNKQLGELTITPGDFNTGFNFVDTSGTQDLLKTINIEYDVDNNPIYEGQVLKGYRFNIITGKFEPKEQLTVDNLEVTIQGATTPLIQNITLPSALTEYSVVFPAGTRKVLVKVRNYECNLQIAWSSGDSLLNYMTIPRGNSYFEKDLELASGLRTLYVSATKSNVIIECLSWA